MSSVISDSLFYVPYPEPPPEEATATDKTQEEAATAPQVDNSNAFFIMHVVTCSRYLFQAMTPRMLSDGAIAENVELEVFLQCPTFEYIQSMGFAVDTPTHTIVRALEKVKRFVKTITVYRQLYHKTPKNRDPEYLKQTNQKEEDLSDDESEEYEEDNVEVLVHKQSFTLAHLMRHKVSVLVQEREQQDGISNANTFTNIVLNECPFLEDVRVVMIGKDGRSHFEDFIYSSTNDFEALFLFYVKILASPFLNSFSYSSPPRSAFTTTTSRLRSETAYNLVSIMLGKIKNSGDSRITGVGFTSPAAMTLRQTVEMVNEYIVKNTNSNVMNIRTRSLGSLIVQNMERDGFLKNRHTFADYCFALSNLIKEENSGQQTYWHVEQDSGKMNSLLLCTFDDLCPLFDFVAEVFANGDEKFLVMSEQERLLYSTDDVMSPAIIFSLFSRILNIPRKDAWNHECVGFDNCRCRMYYFIMYYGESIIKPMFDRLLRWDGFLCPSSSSSSPLCCSEDRRSILFHTTEIAADLKYFYYEDLMRSDPISCRKLRDDPKTFKTSLLWSDKIFKKWVWNGSNASTPNRVLQHFPLAQYANLFRQVSLGNWNFDLFLSEFQNFNVTHTIVQNAFAGLLTNDLHGDYEIKVKYWKRTGKKENPFLTLGDDLDVGARLPDEELTASRRASRNQKISSRS